MHRVRVDVVGIVVERLVEILERDLELALLHVFLAELGMDARRLGLLASSLSCLTLPLPPFVHAPTSAASARTQQDSGDRAQAACATPSSILRRNSAWRRVRSMTWPFSWPQAASMSSPRVRRTIVSTSASSRIFWNARIVSSLERLKRVPWNGLNGIRLTLRRQPAHQLDQLARVLGLVVDAVEHRVFERDRRARRGARRNARTRRAVRRSDISC